MRRELVFLGLLLVGLTTSVEWSLQGCSSSIPPPPDMKLMHAEIRTKFITKFLSDVNDGSNGVVFLYGGTVSLRYTTDTEEAFRQESNFMYLTGVPDPDYAFVLDMQTKTSYLIAPVRDENYALWNGEIKTPEQLKAEYGPDHVILEDQLVTLLKDLSNDGQKTIYQLNDQVLPAPFPKVDKTTLRIILSGSRVTKTQLELSLMRTAALVSSDAHVALMKDSAVGLFEYNYGAYFVYYTTSCGLLHQAYVPIVGSGNRSAILHYNTQRARTTNGDFILIDAGAEFRLYGTDITRTFPVNGKFSPNQKLIYEMVEQVVDEIEALMRAGILWSDVQTIADHGVCQKLLEAGFLKGNLETLISNRVYRYFFPHGIGHSVGLDVHDPGSIAVLQENMVVTVEPGIYFNRVFMEDALTDPVIREFIVVDKVLGFLDANFGGVRIEDTVVVLKNGIEHITTVPKSVVEIEIIMGN